VKRQRDSILRVWLLLWDRPAIRLWREISGKWVVQLGRKLMTIRILLLWLLLWLLVVVISPASSLMLSASSLSMSRPFTVRTTMDGFFNSLI
jgi:hypothetical protein